MSIFSKTTLDASIRFRISEAGRIRLRELAEEEGVGIAEIIRRSLDFYVENRERIQREAAPCDDGTLNDA